MKPFREPGGRPTVIVHELPSYGEAVEAAGYRAVTWPRSPAEQLVFFDREAPRLEAALTIGPAGLPDGLLESAPHLKLIACVGAGFEAFDPAGLAARGVRLVNGGAVNAEDVADVAIGLYLAVQRKIVVADRWIREGQWPATHIRSRRVRGRKCGILGLGSIGRFIAARAEVMGMEVAWHGPRPKPHEALPYVPDARALAEWSDALFLSCPQTPETEGLIDAAMLDALGPEGVLINVARGAVVDEAALIEALRSGRIAGAGLDVFVEEPTDGAKWAPLETVVVHPHGGGATDEALDDGKAVAVENLRRYFAGEPLLTPVN